MQFKNVFGLLILVIFFLIYKTSNNYYLDYNKPATFFVDFDKSMQTNSYACVLHDIDNLKRFNIFKKNYEKNSFLKITKSEKPLIPKIMHQIWLGSQMPQKCVILAQTWQNMHPDWQYRLWTDDDVESFGLENKALFDKAKNFGEKSDIFRYEILYRFGGVYIDTDFECLRPLDIFNHCYNFYVGIQPLDISIVALGIGLIGSIKNHELLRLTIDSLKSTCNNSSILTRTGPMVLTNIFCNNIENVVGVNVALPASYFYPLGLSIKYASNIEKFLNPESFAVHHWHASWIKSVCDLKNNSLK